MIDFFNYLKPMVRKPWIEQKRPFIGWRPGLRPGMLPSGWADYVASVRTPQVDDPARSLASLIASDATGSAISSALLGTQEGGATWQDLQDMQHTTYPQTIDPETAAHFRPAIEALGGKVPVVHYTQSGPKQVTEFTPEQKAHVNDLWSKFKSLG